MDNSHFMQMKKCKDNFKQTLIFCVLNIKNVKPLNKFWLKSKRVFFLSWSLVLKLKNYS